MNTKCPGQDIKNLRAALYKCPKCGAEVEMFSDELRIKCKKCGDYVYKSRLLPVSSGVPRQGSAWERKGGRR